LTITNNRSYATAFSSRSFPGFFMRSSIALAAFALSAQVATAQSKQVALTVVPEVRFDLLAGKNTAVQGGVGLTVPVSNYVGVGGTVAAGVSETGFSTRGDLYGRFSLDPYRQYYWEPYIGGGVTLRHDTGTGDSGTHTYLLGVVGFNGPNTGGIAPGFELGVGGGIRLGITLRWGQPKRID
jgi:hypothetical protein